MGAPSPRYGTSIGGDHGFKIDYLTRDRSTTISSTSVAAMLSTISTSSKVEKRLRNGHSVKFDEEGAVFCHGYIENPIHGLAHHTVLRGTNTRIRTCRPHVSVPTETEFNAKLIQSDLHVPVAFALWHGSDHHVALNRTHIGTVPYPSVP